MSGLRKRFIPLIAFLAIILAAQLAMAASSGRPGSLDTSFGEKGVARVSRLFNGYPKAVAIGQGGSAFIVGSVDAGPVFEVSAPCDSTAQIQGTAWAIVRVKPGGTRDRRLLQRFPGDGSAVHDNEATSVAGQRDGKFVVAGLIDTARKNASRRARTSDTDECEFTDNTRHHQIGGVVRYLPSGQIDRSFGDNGVARLRRLTYDAPQVAIDLRDRIVIADSPEFSSPTKLVRVTARGAVDRRFGRKGVAKLPFEFASITIDDHSRILVTGEDKVERLTAKGRPDKSFGTSGRVRFKGGLVAQAVNTSRGTAVGWFTWSEDNLPEDNRAMVTLLGSSGKPIKSFGSGGNVELGAGYIAAVFEDSSDRLIAVGEAAYPGKDATAWQVTRLRKSGAVDTRFDRLGSGMRSSSDCEGLPMSASPVRRGILIAGCAGTRPGRAGTEDMIARVHR